MHSYIRNKGLTEELAKHIERIMMHSATLFLCFMLLEAFGTVSIVDGPCLRVTQDLICYGRGD